jgi:signal transduction histidine kinase
VKLRRRLLRYLALAAIASCLLTVAVAVVLVRHRIATQRTTALAAQANAVAAAAPLLAGDRVYGVGTGHPRRLGPRRSGLVLAAIPAGAPAQGTATVRGHTIVYVERQTTAGRIVLIRSAAIAFAEWRPFLISLALAGAGGALLAVVLSYLLARRLTRPIAELADATARVAAGHPEVTVPVATDDELGGLAQSFNHMAAELARARESQRRFLESVSHELKTPLTAIRGYAEAIEERAVPADEGTGVIAAEAGRLERLVGDLLDLARVGRSDFAVAELPVDLELVVREVTERHLPRARELEVELTGATSEGQAWALGDGDRIVQAASNLVENALRLTPAGGSVELRAGPGRISVRDTGPGLEESELPRAFERFYLHRRYRSERPVGSGLGLAIVQELVTAMGGSVQARSPASGGAEFVMELPTPECSAQPDAGRPSA